jgi:hypothetical protein
VDVRWILLGCVLPDLAWIVRRIVDPMLDPFASRLYFFPMASLGMTLLLCVAVALLAKRPRLIFGVLALNAIFHFLLDSCQTKLGNGALFFAPISWAETNYGLFWPDQWPSHVLTGLGVLAVAYFWRRGLWQPLRLRLRRWPWAAVLLAAWLALPLTMANSAYRANLQDIRTFKESTIGEPVAVDRGNYADGFMPWTRRTYRLKPAPEGATIVSLEGTLVAPDEISVTRIHIHDGRARDYASFAGLALLAASWIVGLWRGRAQPSEC